MVYDNYLLQFFSELHYPVVFEDKNKEIFHRIRKSLFLLRRRDSLALSIVMVKTLVAVLQAIS